MAQLVTGHFFLSISRKVLQLSSGLIIRFTQKHNTPTTQYYTVNMINMSWYLQYPRRCFFIHFHIRSDLNVLLNIY